MTIAWILYVLLVGTLLAASAGAVASAMRALGRPTRWVWAGALGGIVALAVVAPRQPASRLREPSDVIEPRSALTAAAPAEIGLVARLRATSDRVGDVAIAALSTIERRVPRAVALPILASWAVVSAVLLAVWVLVHLRLARARARWPSVRTHGLAIRIAPDTGPAVLGLLRAEIVVPRSLLERAADDQGLILAHEREHLDARDHLLLAGAWLVAIALPWHPAVWHLLARIRLAIELDCDARVLRRGVPPRSYGALLIDVASHHGGFRLGALALADGPSHLERRILAMNAPRRRHAVAYGAALCGVGTLLLLAACEAKVPTAAEITSMDVAGAQKSAAEAGFMRTPSNDRTDFFINGARVSADQARALEARNIGSIEVVKSELPTGRDTIFVTTADRMSDEARAKATREEDAFEKIERAIESKRRSLDSTEHMVAHVERELAGERMRVRESGLKAKSAGQPLSQRTASRGDEAPLIMIDGRRASEAELAALNEQDIASLAIYKGRDALNLTSGGKNGLQVTSDPEGKIGVKTVGSVIAVTTKFARARATKQP